MEHQFKEKLKDWCRYQPRTHQDVRRKLYDEFSLRKWEVEGLLTDMITEGMLSEEQFAKSFVHDRSKLNGWGRKKITYSMKQRGISDYCVKTALSKIDEVEYQHKLAALIEKKWNTVKGNRIIRKQKTIHYLLQKGYVFAEILPAINTFLEKSGEA